LNNTSICVHDEKLADFLLESFLLLVFSTFLTGSTSILLAFFIIFSSLLSITLSLS